jgi:hypothetical protein
VCVHCLQRIEGESSSEESESEERAYKMDDKKFYRQQKECLEMLLKSILN